MTASQCFPEHGEPHASPDNLNSRVSEKLKDKMVASLDNEDFEQDEEGEASEEHIQKRNASPKRRGTATYDEAVHAGVESAEKPTPPSHQKGQSTSTEVLKYSDSGDYGFLHNDRQSQMSKKAQKPAILGENGQTGEGGGVKKSAQLKESGHGEEDSGNFPCSTENHGTETADDSLISTQGHEQNNDSILKSQQPEIQAIFTKITTHRQSSASEPAVEALLDAIVADLKVLSVKQANQEVNQQLSTEQCGDTLGTLPRPSTLKAVVSRFTSRVQDTIETTYTAKLEIIQRGISQLEVQILEEPIQTDEGEMVEALTRIANALEILDFRTARYMVLGLPTLIWENASHWVKTSRKVLTADISRLQTAIEAGQEEQAKVFLAALRQKVVADPYDNRQVASAAMNALATVADTNSYACHSEALAPAVSDFLDDIATLGITSPKPSSIQGQPVTQSEVASSSVLGSAESPCNPHALSQNGRRFHHKDGENQDFLPSGTNHDHDHPENSGEDKVDQVNAQSITIIDDLSSNTPQKDMTNAIEPVHPTQTLLGEPSTIDNAAGTCRQEELIDDQNQFAKSSHSGLNIENSLVNNGRQMESTTGEIQSSQSPTQAEKRVEEDPEAWRSKINLSAVECCHEGVELSEPPFPFEQRWDPQQRIRNGSRGERSGKRKRSDHRHNQEIPGVTEGLNKRQKTGGYSAPAGGFGRSESGCGACENRGLHHKKDCPMNQSTSTRK